MPNSDAPHLSRTISTCAWEHGSRFHVRASASITSLWLHNPIVASQCHRRYVGPFYTRQGHQSGVLMS